MNVDPKARRLLELETRLSTLEAALQREREQNTQLSAQLTAAQKDPRAATASAAIQPKRSMAQTLLFMVLISALIILSVLWYRCAQACLTTRECPTPPPCICEEPPVRLLLWTDNCSYLDLIMCLCRRDFGAMCNMLRLV
jgi:hypothetical protein